MGVIPNGPDGITPGPVQEVTGVTGGQGIQRLSTFDQPNAEAILKELFVLDNLNLGQIIETVFNGLRVGISLPLAILEAIIKRLLGLPDDYVFFNVEHALSVLKKVPLVSDLVEAVTGEEDGDLTDLGTFMLGVRNAISGIDLSNPGAIIQEIRDAFQEIVDALLQMLGPIPVLGTAALTIANLLGLTRLGAINAQSTADTGLVGLAILTNRVNEIVSGGVTLQDTFDRDLANIENDPSYTTFYGPGSGTMGLTKANNGTTIWNAVGFSDRTIKVRHNTPLATNKQRVSMVINAFEYGFAGNHPNAYLIACANAAMTEYIIAWFGGDSHCEIGVQLTTGYTRIGSASTFSSNTDGALYDLEIGYGTARRFRLLQNNNPKVDVTDIEALAIFGPDHKFTAWGGDCGIGAGPFGTTYQFGPPAFQVFAAADF
jgi:hypothetical protein